MLFFCMFGPDGGAFLAKCPSNLFCILIILFTFFKSNRFVKRHYCDPGGYFDSTSLLLAMPMAFVGLIFRFNFSAAVR